MSHETPDGQYSPERQRSGTGQDKVVDRDAEPGAAHETEEIGGPKGLEPTRYGDWERNGRCIDF